MHLGTAADRVMPTALPLLWLFNSCSQILLRVADVREELLATLTALADFSYGWGLLDAYLPRLQAAVRSIFTLLRREAVSADVPLRACRPAAQE